MYSLSEELLPALQASFAIDVRTRLNIEAWLDAALQRGLITADPRCAQGALRAIVSKSRQEQMLFDQVFENWLEQLARPGPMPLPSDDRRPSDTLPDDPKTPTPTWPVDAAFALLGVLILACFFAFGPGIAPPVVKPQAEAQIADKKNPEATPLDLSRVRDIGRLQIQHQPPRARWLFGIHPSGYAVLVLLLASMGAYLGQVRKSEIARITTRENLRQQHVFARQLLPVSGARRAALRAAARRLRRPRATDFQQLDVSASMRATATRAGMFQARYRQRYATPEYLVLVDRAGSADQQAHWAADMARDLAAEGVRLALYQFDRDPRWVAPLSSHRGAGSATAQAFLPLASLAARHGGQGLLVHTDGQGLVDARTGQLAAWVGPALAPWPSRALITPRPMASWAALENVLGGAAEPPGKPSFLVLPARSDAMIAAAGWFDGAEIRELAPLPGAPAVLPGLLLDDRDRYLGRDAPPGAEVRALLDELRNFLGPAAYTWLAASAAYPYLSADLTAYLAGRLGDASPAATPDPRLLEARLSGIAQLPWCRAAMMPDWLRRALLLSLAPAQRERVRAELETLFRHAGGDTRGPGISLGPVASGAPVPAAKGLAAFMAALRRRLGLAALIETEAPDSPLHDLIYLGVLRGEFDAELRLDATEQFERAVRGEQGARLTRNPLRWCAALGLLLVYPALWLRGRLAGAGRGARVLRARRDAGNKREPRA